MTAPFSDGPLPCTPSWAEVPALEHGTNTVDSHEITARLPHFTTA